MFIQLELGWMQHPFPTNSFRIASEAQIQVLRGLGLKSLRYLPGKSDLPLTTAPMPMRAHAAPASLAATPTVTDQQLTASEARSAPDAASYMSSGSEGRVLDAQSERFRQAAQTCDAVFEQAGVTPDQAREQAQELVHASVQDLQADGNYVTRLLVDNLGQGSAVHAVNVMVLALLLGKALGWTANQLQDVGLAALLHDIGKTVLPPHIAEPGARLLAEDLKRYQNHVHESVQLCQRMGLSESVVRVIAEHHELADGTGFPAGIRGADLSQAGQVVALVNRYDRLCSPLQGQRGLTPHEAVAHLFSQEKVFFDSKILALFIRTMGVYPPGSLVQLTDGRLALVVATDPLQPLRPSVLLHHPEVHRHQAKPLNLAEHQYLGIRRSLKVSQLPRGALEYLLPQKRICYFFERAASVSGWEEGQ